MEEWKNGFFLPQRHREHIEEGMEEFDNATMRQWKNGGCFTTETRRAQRKHEDGTIRLCDNSTM